MTIVNKMQYSPKHINLSNYDTPRWNKFMKVMNEITDEQLPCGGYVSYTFWVKDDKTNVVYECSSRKRNLTEKELYKVIYSCIPDDIKIVYCLGKSRNKSGYSYIKKLTDMSETYDYLMTTE